MLARTTGLPTYDLSSSYICMPTGGTGQLKLLRLLKEFPEIYSNLY